MFDSIPTPTRQESGPLTLLIEDQGEATLHLIKVEGRTEREPGNALSDVEWAEIEWENIGADLVAECLDDVDAETHIVTKLHVRGRLHCFPCGEFDSDWDLEFIVDAVLLREVMPREEYDRLHPSPSQTDPSAAAD